MSVDARRESPLDATESKTLRTCGNSMRENRETPETPSLDGTEGRPEKADCRTSGMYVSGESDDPIVPAKPTNKTGKPEAEPVEGRGSTKGNTIQTAAGRAQNRKHASIGLEGVRQLAEEAQRLRVTTRGRSRMR